MKKGVLTFKFKVIFLFYNLNVCHYCEACVFWMSF